MIEFHIDFEGSTSSPRFVRTLEELKQVTRAINLDQEVPEVPWFPTKMEDFDGIGKNLLVFGQGIEEIDHPGCSDPAYRKRRQHISTLALDYKVSDREIPRVDYTSDENGVWTFIYPRLKTLYAKNACREYNQAINQLEHKLGFQHEIPQLEMVSQFLQAETGWRMKPVGGLLTQREFLNGLAFRLFHSTQYIRHHSKPMYSPEPDVVHELLGHVPMLANKEFSDFSQDIGIASLGADEKELMQLAAIYWFTIEFGLCRQDNQLKVYGGGILGSIGELEYSLSGVPKTHPLDLFEIAQNHSSNFIINAMQPYYFIADSFSRAKDQVVEYCDTMRKPFNITFDQKTNSVIVDRKIKTFKEKTTGPLF